VLAHDIVARRRGEDLIPFRFNTLGLLASIGRRTGVARILGINFSGFVAWWLWRTIYLLKLPRVEKKYESHLIGLWTSSLPKILCSIFTSGQRPSLILPLVGQTSIQKITDADRLSAVH
jgi:hypothetical protein